MSSKITIIGAGSVGSTIAYTLSSQDIASEIVLIDINKQKAEGEVLDIIQGTCFRDPISIIAGEYEEDTAYFDRTRAAIVDTRAWTKQQLEQRGFAVLDSRSNFLFASTNRKDGETLYKELKKNGILVRHFDAPRIQNWLRITIGTPEQMQTFMETLDKIMEE